MEIEELVGQVSARQPDLQVIGKILDTHCDLANGIIKDNASVLHFAARNDVLNGSKLVQWLVEKYAANINFANDGGSVPMLWALAAIDEAIANNKEYFVHSVEWMLKNPKIKMKKFLLYRGELEQYIKNYFDRQEILNIIERNCT